MGTAVITVSQSQNKQKFNIKAQKASIKFKNYIHCFACMTSEKCKRHIGRNIKRPIPTGQ